MYAFDLLYLNGNDLRAVPLEDRKERLRELIHKTDILFSDSFETDGATMFARACVMGIEGVVSKAQGQQISIGTNRLIGSSRHAGGVETLAIVGYALKQNRFDGLYLGRRKGEVLQYAGKVDHGFTSDQVAHLQAKFRSSFQHLARPTRRKFESLRPFALKPMLLAKSSTEAKSAHREGQTSRIQGTAGRSVKERAVLIIV